MILFNQLKGLFISPESGLLNIDCKVHFKVDLFKVADDPKIINRNDLGLHWIILCKYLFFFFFFFSFCPLWP